MTIMNLLETLMQANGGAVPQQIAERFGLDENQAQAAISALVPALSRGVRNNTQSGDGLMSLIGALQGGNHARYVEQPQDALRSDDAVQEGNAILGHVFGSKEVSREVAGRAAEQTGVGQDIMKQMLPVLASAVMGAMASRMSGGDAPAAQASSGGGLADLAGGLLGQVMGGGQSSSSGAGDMGGMLNQFLDADGDGSMLDDVIGMLGRR
ncbi:MAG: hypothetical protein Alpg2KO_18980 [Alphaproteobacteria bacterium]